MSSDATNSDGAATLDGRSPYRVEARGVSKTYTLGELVSLQKSVRYLTDRLARRDRRGPGFRALDDVSFEIEAGECFAIVGSNGSGKSTLAKMIAGITLPSEGEIVTRGRVLPLFNLKAGFQGELTARENVTMFGSLLGMTRAEGRAAIPEIADFAEIDTAHMGTPIKRFSSGEGVRLAFASALCLPADLYLFDEVLNAADDSFKDRCAEKIRHLADNGSSVIFISHEMYLVKSICTRGIWIEKSRLRMTAEMDRLANAYQAHADAQTEAHASGQA